MRLDEAQTVIILKFHVMAHVERDCSGVSFVQNCKAYHERFAMFDQTFR